MKKKNTPLPDSPPKKPVDATAQENPIRSLTGLVLIWIAIGLTFFANEKSERVLRLSRDAEAASAMPLVTGVSAGAEPILKLMLPLDLKQLQTPPLQMIVTIAELLDMNEPGESSLSIVRGLPARDVAFKAEPAYRVLHELTDVNDGSLGLMVRDNTLGLIEQTSSFTREGRDQWVLEWSALQPLEAKPFAIVPSGEKDLWFSVALTGSIEMDVSQWDRVRLEVWRGGSLINASTLSLDAQGRAGLQQTGQGDPTFAINFSVEPRKAEAAVAPDLYRMKLQYREMTPEGSTM